MKTLLTICFSVFRLMSHSQEFEVINSDTVNRIDKKGLKQGKWIEFYGENGRSEIYYINGKEEGEYRFYDINNNIKEQGFYRNGKGEGQTSEFINGKLWRTRVYKNDKLISQIIEYFENEKPKTGGNYFAGKGELLRFDSLGFIISKMTYKNYKREGAFEEYFPNRQLKENGIYRNNKYWTIDNRFDSTGYKIDFGTIKNGNGYINYFDSAGRLTKSAHYKSGKLWNVFWYRIQPMDYENIGNFKNGNGIIKEFDASGNLISELRYKNGLLNGICKFLYGETLVVGECINDDRQGKWVRYYKGKIQNILHFKNDREIGISCF